MNNRIDNENISFIKFIDFNWNSLPGICVGNRPIIKHYAGRPYNFRLENMRSDFQQILGVIT